jgi:cellulose synthase/poly-beta-1,6-N-acetylglucosamine synthase-like glycosyltransferase
MIPRISVVIPAYNAAATLPACLAALGRQVNVPAPFEVLVIDDGSCDSTAAVVRQFSARLPGSASGSDLAADVQLLQQPHAGAAAARNRGIQAARGELIFFTDADCVPADDWLAAMARPFERPGVAGCEGVYATRQTELIARFAQLEYQVKYRAMAGCDSIDFVGTNCGGYRRPVLLAAGGFDSSLPGACVEDVELAFRVSALGHRLVFNPAAVVRHRHPATLRGYLARKAHYGFWRARVYARHPAKLRGDAYTPRAMRWQMLLACVGSLAGVAAWLWPAALGVFAAALALFLLMCLPFVRPALKQSDLGLALIAPLVLWLRALALAGGLLLGAMCLCYNLALSQAARPRSVREQHL